MQYGKKLQKLEDTLRETGETGPLGDTWNTGYPNDTGDTEDTGLISSRLDA